MLESVMEDSGVCQLRPCRRFRDPSPCWPRDRFLVVDNAMGFLEICGRIDFGAVLLPMEDRLSSFVCPPKVSTPPPTWAAWQTADIGR